MGQFARAAASQCVRAFLLLLISPWSAFHGEPRLPPRGVPRWSAPLRHPSCRLALQGAGRNRVRIPNVATFPSF